MNAVEESPGFAWEIRAGGAAKHPVTEDALPLQSAYRWERTKPNEVFLTQPSRGEVRDWTWAQTMDEVRRMAAYLEAQGWPPGSRVVILSKNCAWWIMAELATWMAGHVTVPIYPSLTAASVRTMVEHCEPVACFLGHVEDPEITPELLPDNVPCITFPTAARPGSQTWESIIASTPAMTQSPVRRVDDIATIIYTSGTTGLPKGAMHRFLAFQYFVAAGVRVVGEDGSKERMLCYLSLAHIAERALVETLAIATGVHVYFVEKLETFLTDIKRARPTIFFSVPRLYIKFQQNVLAKVPEHKLGRMLRIPVLRRIVQKRILRELGLDCVKVAACGSASLPLSTLLWFRRVGLNLVEGFGMTETGITHTPVNGRSMPAYVGDAVADVEAKISENGELLLRSPMNMVGYFKDPEATAAAFTEDGFFRTGDLADINSEGWLRIVGRAKEQFKTSKGKYVSPTPIEKLLSVHPSIEGCCVMGAGMAQPFAIIVPSQEVWDCFSDPMASKSLERSLTSLLDEVNGQLESHERLDFAVVVDQKWTVSSGILTPTMKLRRSVLEKTYAQYFDDWSRQRSSTVWHVTPVDEATQRKAAS